MVVVGAYAGGSLPHTDRAAANRRFAFLTGGLVLLSLILRVNWVCLGHATPISDFRSYDRMAGRILVHGDFGKAYLAPGWPVFVAGVYAVSDSSLLAVQLASALLGALTSGLIVLLARRIVSTRASILAGAMHALSPTALAYTPVLASENLAVPLLVGAAVLLGIVQQSSSWRRNGAAVGAGVISGYLVLVRPAAVFLFPALLLCALFNLRRRSWCWQTALLFVAGSALLVTPWVIRNHYVIGKAALSTNGGVNLLMGNNDLATTGAYCPKAVFSVDQRKLDRDQVWRSAAFEWIWTHPLRYAELSATRALRLLGVPYDYWAAKYLRPTLENDQVLSGEVRVGDDRDAVWRSRVLRRENGDALVYLRLLSAPLTALALILSFVRWRAFAIAVFPALCYLGGLSATYAQMRFRELSNPLLLIPLAALLSDVLFASTDLGARPSRWTKVLLVVLVLGIHAYLHFSGSTRGWYELTGPA